MKGLRTSLFDRFLMPFILKLINTCFKTDLHTIYVKCFFNFYFKITHMYIKYQSKVCSLSNKTTFSTPLPLTSRRTTFACYSFIQQQKKKPNAVSKGTPKTIRLSHKRKLPSNVSQYSKSREPIKSCYSSFIHFKIT